MPTEKIDLKATEAQRYVLSLNIGSSSLKFALYALSQAASSKSQTGWSIHHDPCIRGNESLQPSEAALDAALVDLAQKVKVSIGENGQLVAVAHRIVHGGRLFSGPAVLAAKDIVALEALSPLAPLHQPFNLRGIRACEKAFPGVMTVGCFDTAFHFTMPEVERRFALPQSYFEQGIGRYGFHGLSYDYVARRMQEASPKAKGRMLMAHLGNGASLCAAVNGQSIASSMGFSAVDGLVMGTRCGAIDPGVLLYLLQQGQTPEAIERLLYKESGLLGLSGESSDMRSLLGSSRRESQMAVQVFLHRLVREMGGLVALLQGLDVLVFTGGIGENQPVIRQEACDQLAYLGLLIDPLANEQASRVVGKGHPLAIHAADSSAEIWVLATDEGRVAAEQAVGLYSASLGV